jgi:ribose transport system substrate-binding protein
MKIFITSIVSLIGAFTLISCGGDSSQENSKGGENPSKVIGVSLMTLSNPFFVELGDAVKEEAEKHGFTVNAILSGDNAEKQANQMRDFISQGVAAIIIAPTDHYGIGEIIKEANAKNIPVFTADTGCTDKSAKVTCNVMTDNFGGGVFAGQAIIEALENKGGEVLILSYDDAQSCLLRVEGFKKKISEWNTANPNAAIKIVAELPGKAEQNASKQAAEDALNAHPNLNAVFAINDPSAIGAVVAIENANKQKSIKVVGFDGQRIGKEYIRDGRIFADPIQFPKLIGQTTVQKIAAYFNGDTVEKEILIDTALYYQKDAKNDPDLK